MSLLFIALILPLIGFFVILFTPRESKMPFYIALGITLITFFVSLGLIAPVFAGGAQFTSVVDWNWVTSPELQIHFHMGVDGINLWLVLLTSLLLPIGVWVSRWMIADRQKTFFALLLLFEFGLI